MCTSGQCVSVCDPLCGEDEVCTDVGKCVQPTTPDTRAWSDRWSLPSRKKPRGYVHDGFYARLAAGAVYTWGSGTVNMMDEETDPAPGGSLDLEGGGASFLLFLGGTLPGGVAIGGALMSTSTGSSEPIYVAVAVIAAAIGLSGGRALGLYRFRGKRGVELFLLAPVIVPSIAVAMGIQIIFIRAGIAGGIPGVVLVHLIPTIPYVVLVMGAVFSNYDTSYEDQARVLGANPLRVFIHVTLPAVLPGLVVAAFFAFLISWSEYITTVLIGQGRVQTLPMLLFAFIRSDPSLAAALSLFFIAPAIVLMILTSRYLSGDQSAVGGIGRA
jgi:putative spermidine/putrescine transport system permease protein